MRAMTGLLGRVSMCFHDHDGCRSPECDIGQAGIEKGAEEGAEGRARERGDARRNTGAGAGVAEVVTENAEQSAQQEALLKLIAERDGGVLVTLRGCRAASDRAIVPWLARFQRCRQSPTLRVDSILRLGTAHTRPRLLSDRR
jgi:hypothetical protein